MQKPSLSRRLFLKQSSLVSVGFLGLQTFVTSSLSACRGKSFDPDDKRLYKKYGSLKKDPKGILKLPNGFSYKVLAKTGQVMNDGLLSPDKPDGMAAFNGENGNIVLVRNHEIVPDNADAFGADRKLLSKVPREKFYDYGFGKTVCNGGTSTLVINEKNLSLEKSYLSLTGTLRNCAGGPTPWNSWITCEEIVMNASHQVEKDHGYNFEVPATEKIGLVDPIPLKEMGRFNHEAVAVNPHSGIVYQTEDRHDGLIYRFIPNTPGQLYLGGKLQVLSIKDFKSFDTRNWPEIETPLFHTNKKYEVEWLDIDEVNAPNDNLRGRGFDKGAARFARGEGMWYGNDAIYFACTNGGKTKSGQVFKYEPSTKEGTSEESKFPGTLELFIEPNNSALLEYCDNLTIAPSGDVILVEDKSDSHIIGITPEGRSYKIAENVGFRSEMAGVCFSPSGKTLFVSIQHAGLTLAIQGPWV